jgi:hypothetical protein
MKKDLGTGLDLVADALLDSTFPPEAEMVAKSAVALVLN